MSFTLTTCSTADLSAEHLRSRGIPYVCFHYTLNGETYLDDLGQTRSSADFYKAMEEGADTATAQVNISEYLDFFTPMLEQGQDILHICLSSGLSGSYNSAVNAALIAREQFPDRKVYVVDSLGASSGLGLLVDKLADLRDAGLSIEEARDWAEENKLKVNLWFFSTDLKYFVRGGRISKTSGFVGSVLGICPLLNMDEEGHLVPRSKIRTKKRVIAEIVARMEEYAENGTDYDGKCFISQSSFMEEAKTVAEMIEARFPKLNGKVQIFDIGTTIGSHTGPGTVALFFFGRDRSLPLL